ncbi:hypothetical protein U9M48_021970 [Paspalum notatum var. saurae]|uniref:Uncharacterized protein n=1 Tax=Paspalum notatum var. saurae TaxID=547442 RepID=A0AAQ3THE4_PASNO
MGTHLVASFSRSPSRESSSPASLNVHGCFEGARVHGLDGGSSKAPGMPNSERAVGRWGFGRPRARQQVVDGPGMESTGRGRGHAMLET